MRASRVMNCSVLFHALFQRGLGLGLGFGLELSWHSPVLAASLGADPGHFQLKVLVLVVVVDEVDAADESVPNFGSSGCMNLHARNLVDGLATGDSFTTIRLLGNELLELSLRQRLALADGTGAVAIEDSRGLDTEQAGTGLVNTSNQARDTKGPNGAVAGVSLDVARQAVRENLNVSRGDRTRRGCARLLT